MEQDRQCTYNVTLRRVRVTIVVVEKQYYILCVCIRSLSYPACNAHAPHCHLWPTRLYDIFPHYLINGTIFGKKKSYGIQKCVLIFSKTFLILRRNERRMIKMCIYLHVKYPLFLSDFNET
jgi:hypothetical protein